MMASARWAARIPEGVFLLGLGKGHMNDTYPFHMKYAEHCFNMTNVEEINHSREDIITTNNKITEYNRQWTIENILQAIDKRLGDDRQ